MTHDPGPSTSHAPRDHAEVGAALAAVALGGLIFVFSGSIDLGTGYDRIGPRFFPSVVGLGLIGSGLLMLHGAWRGPRSADPRPVTHWPAVLMLIAALTAATLLLDRAGFVPAAGLLFWLAARAFQSRRPVRDAIVGLLLCLSVHLAFTRGLGLVLPRGILEGIL